MRRLRERNDFERERVCRVRERDDGERSCVCMCVELRREMMRDRVCE